MKSHANSQVILAREAEEAEVGIMEETIIAAQTLRTVISLIP